MLIGKRRSAGIIPVPLVASLALVLVVALACWGCYRHGRTVEAGEQALQRQHDIVAAAQAARADAQAEALAEQAAQQRHARTVVRVMEVDREAAKLPPRPECDWTAAELRISTQRWCARYSDADPARCLPDEVPPPANPEEPPH